MELDITNFFATAAPADYSASQAEIGATAGADTWLASCDDSEEYPLLDAPDKRAAFSDFVLSSGGWSQAEIEAWSDAELNALCIQWVSGDMRECGIGPGSTAVDWARLHDEQIAGQVSSRLFRADDGRVCFDISE